MSIIPGIETAAPERTETSSGSSRVAEALAGPLLEPRDVLGDLVLEPLDLAAARHVGAAGVGRDREAGGDGDPELRHLREPDPLAAEQLAAAVGGLVEVVDVARHDRMLSYGRAAAETLAASPGAELGEPGDGAEADPERREQDVEDDSPRRRG